jgi:4-hydroxybenzoate polyprenyltransferase
MARSLSILSWVPVLQGVYYVLGGIWPLVSMSTFIAVTGPKADLWLVHTVGLLLIVIGVALAYAGIRRRITPEIVVLGIGTALAIAGIDFFYAAIDRISAVYFLDGIAEVALVIGWVLGGRRRPAPVVET